MNEETFDDAEIGWFIYLYLFSGDWEFAHDKFVSELKDKSPNADELPNFWGASDGLSFLWQSDDVDNKVNRDDLLVSPMFE